MKEKYYHCIENSWQLLKKLSPELPSDQHPHSQAYTREDCTQVLKQTLVHMGSYIVHNRQKLETTLIPTSERMDKQNVVYPYNGILLSYTK